jgi:hypothetical protein
MHPLSEQLARVYIRDFAAADREIQWIATEQEHSLWLAPNTVLVGRVDGEGITGDGDHFFLENKTMSAYRGRFIEEEKVKWRSDTQALTYGVLMGDKTRRFTVRWAIKPDERSKTPTPKTDFEWYTYTTGEVAHWRNQLVSIATEIRARRSGPLPWRTNFGACFRYGMKYACPFFDKCSTQKWLDSMGKPRIPHLKIEPVVRSEWKDLKYGSLVVLDASRVGDYLECPESYRRKWEGEGYQEEGEALTIGTDFHSLVSEHIKSLIKEKVA